MGIFRFFNTNNKGKGFYTHMHNITLGDLQEMQFFFGNMDAFTGEQFTKANSHNLNYAWIIPPILNEEVQIKHNLVPCLGNNITFIDEYALNWYQNQDFFDEDRFLRICKWLSFSDELSYYKKYLNIPKCHLRYIDTFDNNASLQRFPIKLPLNKKIFLYYSNRINRNALINQVNNIVIKPIKDYITENWLDNSYGCTNPSRLLDRCADYILNGELDYQGNLKYQKYETPISCSDMTIGNITGLNEAGTTLDFYDDDYKYTNEREKKYSEEICEKERNRKSRKKSECSCFYKINQLFSRPSFERSEIKKLKNHEVFGHVDPEIDEKHAKNIHNQFIEDVELFTYKAHDGIIQSNQDYLISWQYVFSDGEFTFDKCKFQIDIGHHQQYVDLSKTNRKGRHTYWSMDKILCIKQFDTYHFYDMKIEKVKHVHELEE